MVVVVEKRREERDRRSMEEEHRLGINGVSPSIKAVNLAVGKTAKFSVKPSTK